MPSISGAQQSNPFLLAPNRASTSGYGSSAADGAGMAMKPARSAELPKPARTANVPPSYPVAGTSRSGSSKAPPPVASKPAALRPPPPKPKPARLATALPRAIALYDFQAQQPGDLAFKADDVIEIIERTPDANGWWKGQLNGQEGIFPANYIRML